jgi:hypothetical protein
MLKDKEEDEIIRTAPSISAYVDENFYKKVMKEDPDNDNFKTFAVKMVAVRADWLINEEIGL